MDNTSEPDRQESLVDTWEDQAIRRAFHRWRCAIKPPSGVWERISQQISQLEISKKSQKTTLKPS